MQSQKYDKRCDNHVRDGDQKYAASGIMQFAEIEMAADGITDKTQRKISNRFKTGKGRFIEYIQNVLTDNNATQNLRRSRGNMQFTGNSGTYGTDYQQKSENNQWIGIRNKHCFSEPPGLQMMEKSVQLTISPFNVQPVASMILTFTNLPIRSGLPGNTVILKSRLFPANSSADFLLILST